MATSAWEGWVFKHGSIFPTWKKIYMVLRGTQLVYYDKAASHPKAREKGVFQLANAQRDKSVKNGFILTNSDGKRARIYLSTSEESTACLSAMNHALHPQEVKVRRQSTESRNHSGWLGMDGKGSKKWYFVLSGIDLSNYERVNGPEIGRGRLADILFNERRNTFTFVFTNGRQLPVAAESENDAQDWYLAVCSALNKPPTRMTAQSAPRVSLDQQHYGQPSSRELDVPNHQISHEEPHRASTRHTQQAPVVNHLPSPSNERVARATTPEITPTRNYTPPNPEVASARASTPPKPEATPARAPTPPKPEPTPVRASTPPRPEARPATPPRPEPTRASTPLNPESMPPRAPTPPKHEASKAEAIGLPPKPNAPVPRPTGFAPKPLYKPPRAPTPVASVAQPPKEVDQAQFANKAAEIWNLTDPTLVQAWVEHGKSKPVAVPEPPQQHGPKLQSFLDKYMRIEEEPSNHTTQTSL
ncbi:hypothetical protein THRCLA_09564 [Thraustotheca clavata]|uniref:PH domain-containing protein n=1 Tax=Thraustotheca clavata TaxID=74557 RepID=A0A1V9YVT8_9STRA|nr:hypothetical protein THRCLA_09564 [Thraustotheca clavata]